MKNQQIIVTYTPVAIIEKLADFSKLAWEILRNNMIGNVTLNTSLELVSIKGWLISCRLPKYTPKKSTIKIGPVIDSENKKVLDNISIVFDSSLLSINL